jgi:hypothetical protein
MTTQRALGTGTGGSLGIRGNSRFPRLGTTNRLFIGMESTGCEKMGKKSEVPANRAASGTPLGGAMNDYISY